MTPEEDELEFWEQQEREQQQEQAGQAAQSEAPGGGAVGSGDYVVQEGDCISSIASAHGHFWETIWDAAANAELREAREDPNVLLPGDRLTVPERREKWEARPTEQRHRFRRRGEPAMLRLRFLACGEPRAGEPYRIEVDGRTVAEGTLDDDGMLEVPIPPAAGQALAAVGEPGQEDVHEFALGGTDPVTELRGVQQRLINLSYGCDLEAELGESTRAAIRAFQAEHDLEETGEPDEATRQALLDAHGS